MNSLFTVIVILALIQSIGLSKAKRTDIPREIVLLDADWRFHLGDVTNAINPAYDDRNVAARRCVPHDHTN